MSGRLPAFPFAVICIHHPLQTILSVTALIFSQFLSCTFFTMPGALVTLFINLCMLIWMAVGAPRAVDVAMADMMVMIVWLLGLIVGLVRISDMPGAPEELVHPGNLSNQGEGRGVAVWVVCGVALAANLGFWGIMIFYGFDTSSIISFRKAELTPHTEQHEPRTFGGHRRQAFHHHRNKRAFCRCNKMGKMGRTIKEMKKAAVRGESELLGKQRANAADDEEAVCMGNLYRKMSRRSQNMDGDLELSPRERKEVDNAGTQGRLLSQPDWVKW